MGILKDAIRSVIEKDAKERGLDIQFLDTPTRVIETREQAKRHDMELVEKPSKPKYASIVYKHNPSTYKESDLLFLYVFNDETQKVVGYISFGEHSIHVCRGCAFGEYNAWRDGCHLTSYGLNMVGLKEATEYFEGLFSDDKYQFIITAKGMAHSKKLKKGGSK